MSARMSAAGLAFALAGLAAAPAPAQSLRDLRADVAALGARVGRLEDFNDVQNLQRAYGYYVDASQFYDVTDLFARDSRLEIGGRGVFLGRARIFAYLEQLGPTMGLVHDSMYNHQQFQPVVTVAPDGESARARVAAFVMAGSVWGDVTYENAYVKEDGVWKISSLRAPFNMYTEYADSWAVATSPNTRPESWAPPPDLPPSAVYLTFPNYYVAPFHFANPVTGRPAPSPDPAAGGTAPMEARR